MKTQSSRWEPKVSGNIVALGTLSRAKQDGIDKGKKDEKLLLTHKRKARARA